MTEGTGKPTPTVYRSATGELVRDNGPAELIGIDENQNKRRVKGAVVGVHKPLLSASAVARHRQDIWLGDDGGYIMSKDGPISRGLRERC